MLANNLANANTPGFVRRDVDFHSALDAALTTRGTSTERIAAIANAGFVTSTDGAAKRADGGGVDVETENAQIAANALEQQAAVTVARARLDILTSAMGRPQ